MRLLDVALVVPTDGHFPRGGDPRHLNVDVLLEDVCEDDSTTNVVVGSSVGTFVSEPFAIVAELQRSVSCQRPDDSDFLDATLKDVTDRAVGKALASSEDLLGSASVESAADVVAARTAWFASRVGVPILHVAPEDLPQMIKDDVVKVYEKGSEHYTVWGEPVVVNEGYVGVNPFWTGPIEIHLSSVRAEALVNPRGNFSQVLADRQAVILLSPEDIVSVSA